MNPRMPYCPVCGCALEDRPLEHEGIVPFCPECNEYRFPMYNIAVSMIVVNESNGQVLLVKQYGKDFYRLVAGYVNRTETLEHAAVRELKEETGMTAVRIRFNRTAFFEPSNTLMCNFTVCVKDDRELSPNYEIDACHWFDPADVLNNMKPGILAERFMSAWLSDRQRDPAQEICLTTDCINP